MHICIAGALLCLLSYSPCRSPHVPADDAGFALWISRKAHSNGRPPSLPSRRLRPPGTASRHGGDISRFSGRLQPFTLSLQRVPPFEVFPAPGGSALLLSSEMTPGLHSCILRMNCFSTWADRRSQKVYRCLDNTAVFSNTDTATYISAEHAIIYF